MIESIGPSGEMQQFLGGRSMEIHHELSTILDNETTRKYIKKIALQGAFIIAGQAAATATTGATMLLGYELGDKIPIASAHDPVTAGIMLGGYIFNWATNIKGASVEVDLVEDEKIGVSTNLLLTGVNKVTKLIAPQLTRTRIAITAGTGLVMSGLTELEWWNHINSLPQGWTMLTCKEYGAAAGGLGWVLVRSAIKKRFGERVSKDIDTQSLDPVEKMDLKTDSNPASLKQKIIFSREI